MEEIFGGASPSVKRFREIGSDEAFPLPAEVLSHVFSFMTYGKISQVRRVCQYWDGVAVSYLKTFHQDALHLKRINFPIRELKNYSPRLWHVMLRALVDEQAIEYVIDVFWLLPKQYVLPVHRYHKCLNRKATLEFLAAYGYESAVVTRFFAYKYGLFGYKMSAQKSRESYEEIKTLANRPTAFWLYCQYYYVRHGSYARLPSTVAQDFADVVQSTVSTSVRVLAQLSPQLDRIRRSHLETFLGASVLVQQGNVAGTYTENFAKYKQLIETVRQKPSVPPNA